MTFADAPGKVILFGEHAVVHGQPAIAVPVRELRAIAEVSDIRGAPPGEAWIEAPDTGFRGWLRDCDRQHPLARITRLTLDELGVHDFPAVRIRVTSTIPIAAGLGSGAAVSIAVLRALSKHLNRTLSLERQSSLAFQVEEIHHGTPSGIDNTVIAYEQPVYFVKGSEPALFRPATTFTIVIGDTGRPSPTLDAVERVSQQLQEERFRVEALFEAIGQTVQSARHAIEDGRIKDLGPLMDHNQALLEGLRVSSHDLEWLIRTARGAGALGAKLSGSGLGGNVIALVEPETAQPVTVALRRAGAKSTYRTEVIA